MDIRLVICFTLLTASQLFAGDADYAGKLNTYSEVSAKEIADAVQNEYIKGLSSRSKALNLSQVLAASAEDQASEIGKSCLNLYGDMATKEEININISYGYKDYYEDFKLKDGRKSRAVYTNDIQQKLALIKLLQLPCDKKNENYFACSFKLAKENSELETETVLEKTILDPSTKKRTFRISIVHSSIWSNVVAADPKSVLEAPAKNPGMILQKINDKQKAASEAAQTAFLNSLSSADVVFFSGNSRAGNSLDFFPPQGITNNKDSNYLYPDYAWYHQNSSINKVIDQIKSAPTGPKIIAIFSSASQMRFGNLLAEASRNSSLVLNTGIEKDGKSSARMYSYDEPLLMFGALNAVLGNFCNKSLEGSMGSSKIDPRSHMSLQNALGPDQTSAPNPPETPKDPSGNAPGTPSVPEPKDPFAQPGQKNSKNSKPLA